MKVTKLQSGTVPHVNTHVAVVTIEAEGNAPKNRHTILLLDCSQSMEGSIGAVRNDSIRFIGQLGHEDYVSVIKYSGHNTAELIAGPTSCISEGQKLLTKAIQAKIGVMNTTVFSEPLAKALATAKMLAHPDMGHNAVVFTDGCPVPTRWSEREEWSRTQDVAEDLYKAGVVVSLIGYGLHYDEKFIRMVMSASGNTGVFRHISEIEDFVETVQDIRSAFEKTTLTDGVVRITPPPKSGRTILRVLRAVPNLVDLGNSGEIRLGSLYEDKVTLFVELSDSLNQFDISLRGMGRSVANTAETRVKADSLSDESMQEYIRVLGAHVFLTGNREQAAMLLNVAGDGILAGRVETSYTNREQRETGDKVRRLFRNRAFIGGKLKPVGPNHSLLHVIRALIEDPQSVVYIPTGGYKRGGIAMRDPRVIENPHTRVLRVLGYSSNAARFNFGLRTLKDVKVLPLEGGRPKDMYVWRTYNVVLDGNRHMAQLEATLSEATFDLLQEAKVVKTNMRYDPARSYTLYLQDLATISGNYARPQTLGLARLLEEEADLEVLQTALNARLDQFSYKEPLESTGDIYRESLQPVEDVQFEYYNAPCVEIRLMGYKPQPILDISRLTSDETLREVRRVRHRLIVVRYIIRSITFAMETVGSHAIPWGTKKETSRGKYPKTEQLATFDDAKLKRVSWVEQAVCS